MVLSLPPMTHDTVNLLNGPQEIEIGMVDDRLVAWVLGHSYRIDLSLDERIRIELCGCEPTNTIVAVACYRVTPD